MSRKPCCYLDDASAKRNEGNTYSSKIVLACERPENGNGRFDIPATPLHAQRAFKSPSSSNKLIPNCDRSNFTTNFNLISFYSFDSILIQTFKNNNIAEHLDFYSIPILYSINYNINFIKNLIIEALLQLLIPINP